MDLFVLCDASGQRLAVAQAFTRTDMPDVDVEIRFFDTLETRKLVIARNAVDQILPKVARELCLRGRVPVGLPPLLAMELSLLTDSDRK